MQIGMSNFKSDLWIDPHPFVDIMLGIGMNRIVNRIALVEGLLLLLP